jgi:hypothetical protein
MSVIRGPVRAVGIAALTVAMTGGLAAAAQAAPRAAAPGYTVLAGTASSR